MINKDKNTCAHVLSTIAVLYVHNLYWETTYFLQLIVNSSLLRKYELFVIVSILRNFRDVCVCAHICVHLLNNLYPIYFFCFGFNSNNREL